MTPMKGNKSKVEMGMNKTGLQTAPIQSKEMLSGTSEFDRLLTVSEVTPDEVRKSYIQASAQFGTIPLPGTMKGAVTTTLKKITGGAPEVLIDKLGERAAFERSGVRLYDSLITKCESLAPGIPLDLLHHFRSEELEHFQLVARTMKEIGADPTAQTPCADAAAVASSGLMQLINDPRSSLQQCVQSILIAELADNDSWELLIQIVQNAGLKDTAKEFQNAKAAEDDHLRHIRAWFKELVMKDSAVPIPEEEGGVTMQ